MKDDVIGDWSENKLEIIEKYARPYSQIMTSKGFYHIYIDAFAGSGRHISRRSEKEVLGSPRIALATSPPFREYHFVEWNEKRAEGLRVLEQEHSNLKVYFGDCNNVLPREIFPLLARSGKQRALCILDPYALNYDWNLICAAAQTKKVDLILTFMMMDVQMNVLLKDPNTIKETQAKRLTRSWGDETWRKAAYEVHDEQLNMFGGSDRVKTGSLHFAKEYGRRLKEVAGFEYVSDPVEMLNSRKGTVYYLYFMSHASVALKIMKDIVTRLRKRQVGHA
ncbi:MAG: three-Cys-motif partner protein TcmP [Calditrichaeota bacterium]|nr:three-Cys-motif partner protein TcmP [Calditrichota bacterium]MCB9369377.1 three-Cys-motif partner protein TcmP [Calditrichota bacterium]